MVEFRVVTGKGEDLRVTAARFDVSKEGTLQFYGGDQDVIAAFPPEKWSRVFKNGALDVAEKPAGGSAYARI